MAGLGTRSRQNRQLPGREQVPLGPVGSLGAVATGNHVEKMNLYCAICKVMLVIFHGGHSAKGC